jgi:hypothetical protein
VIPNIRQPDNTITHENTNKNQAEPGPGFKSSETYNPTYTTQSILKREKVGT